MSQRIQKLEDALELLQSSVSSEKHALLQEDLLLIKCGADKPTLKKPEIVSDDLLAETLNAFGTLAIDDRGEARYFGASAAAEVRSTIDSLENNPNL